MSKIKVITDSTAYIKKEYIDMEDIGVVPLKYTLGDESGKEGILEEFDDYFKRLESTKLFPSTSQPAAGEFLDEFNKAFEEGYEEIIAILLSSKLSGTYNSAKLAANMLEDKRITIIDSETSVSNLRFLVEDAVNMAKENKTLEDIERHINNKKKNMEIYLTTGTLEYLSRGGRLSTLESTVGNILNIKPIIELADGELKLLEKTRGKNKAIQLIVSKVPSTVSKIGICSILNDDEAEKVKNILEDKFPNAIISRDELGPVIGSHLGPKTIGICFY